MSVAVELLFSWPSLCKSGVGKLFWPVGRTLPTSGVNEKSRSFSEKQFYKEQLRNKFLMLTK